jgi:DNA-directed RNA polymerase specialized sigma54-like protein
MQRDRALAQCANEILAYARGTLFDGSPVPTPHMTREIGTLMGIHESTVERMTAGTSIAGPAGAFPMRAFVLPVEPLPEEADEP